MTKLVGFIPAGGGAYKVHSQDCIFLEPMAKTLSKFSGREVKVTEDERGYYILLDAEQVTQCFIMLHNFCLHSDDGIGV